MAVNNFMAEKRKVFLPKKACKHAFGLCFIWRFWHDIGVTSPSR